MKTPTQDQLLGVWENSDIKYSFNEDKSVDILWKKEGTTKSCVYNINEENTIVFIYGYSPLKDLDLRGKINYISNTVLSIKDLSNEMNIEYRLSFGNKTIFKKKNFKTKVNDIFTLSIILAIISLIGYYGYKDFIEYSNQLQYFILGIFSFSAIIFINVSSKIKGPFDIINDNPWSTYLIIFFAVPLFFLISRLIFYILSVWSIWISIFLIIAIINTWLSKVHLVKKILLTAITIITIYFLVKSNDIFRIEYQLFFNFKELFNDL